MSAEKAVSPKKSRTSGGERSNLHNRACRDAATFFEQRNLDNFSVLKETDPEVFQLIVDEFERQEKTLQLVAAENRCSRAVLAALGSILQNKTAEGPPSERLHGGCAVVNQLEQLAVERARQAFGAQYANVQPHSGTQANQIVLNAVLEKGDTILSLPVEQGGHFSHSYADSVTGKLFRIEHYYLDPETLVLDYEAIRRKALACRPKMIICGASAYPRTINFAEFKRIADALGAYLLADISHISGLVIAGAHPSPVDCAHFTTTSTYKPGGPRGGLVLMGDGFDKIISVGGKARPIWQHIDFAAFPCVQGTPYFNNIAAKAVFFQEVCLPEYRQRQFKIIENAKALADSLVRSGFKVLTGGTDNHMIVVDVSGLRKGLTGTIAQKALEDCGIVTDPIELPLLTGGQTGIGIRLGTPIVTKRGLGPAQMETISMWIDSVLKEVEITSTGGYKIDEAFRLRICRQVEELCSRFPFAD